MPKGLEILIPKKQSKNEPKTKENVFWIEIKKIKPNPLQPRKMFDEKELKELADSIEKYGILQPLIAKKIVKKVPRGENVEYQLIAGERRLRAAQMLKMKELPVIIREIKTEEELPISLVENIQREDLNAIEKALAYKELLEKHNLTQKEIGKIVGKSRESIANTLRLLELPETIKKSIIKEEITEGHARALLSVPEKERMKIFKEIIEKKIPVRKIEEKSAKRIIKEKKSPFLKLEKEIKDKTGAKSVKIKETNGNLELKILFNHKKDLNDFINKINL